MAIVNGYTDLATLKARLGIGDTKDDATLEAIIAAVSRWIDEYCGTRFYTTDADETRYYTASRADRLLLPFDLLSVTSLATDDGTRAYATVWGASDYDLEPADAPLDGKPYWEIVVAPQGNHAFPVGVPRGVRVTGKFGYCTAANRPAAITEACLLRCMQIFALKAAPFGQVGGEGVAVTMTLPVYGIVCDLLNPYRLARAG